ncbi:hypothetical protein C8R45DRAFT_940329 [Mycena sanguinolenta]|nr:hypothetical protein C8R45DRAFT_940329 [Mycena sanguinolenta]
MTVVRAPRGPSPHHFPSAFRATAKNWEMRTQQGGNLGIGSNVVGPLGRILVLQLLLKYRTYRHSLSRSPLVQVAASELVRSIWVTKQDPSPAMVVFRLEPDRARVLAPKYTLSVKLLAEIFDLARTGTGYRRSVLIGGGRAQLWTRRLEVDLTKQQEIEIMAGALAPNRYPSTCSSWSTSSDESWYQEAMRKVTPRCASVLQELELKLDTDEGVTASRILTEGRWNAAHFTAF